MTAAHFIGWLVRLFLIGSLIYMLIACALHKPRKPRDSDDWFV